MLEKSSNSAKITFLNGEEIKEQLRLAAQRLRENPNVLRVLLFGSLVRGDYVPSSDADICIILKEGKGRIMDRIPEFLGYFMDVDIGVDIFPYTTEEIERMKNSENLFIKEILEKGVEI